MAARSTWPSLSFSTRTSMRHCSQFGTLASQAKFAGSGELETVAATARRSPRGVRASPGPQPAPCPWPRAPRSPAAQPSRASHRVHAAPHRRLPAHAAPPTHPLPPPGAGQRVLQVRLQLYYRLVACTELRLQLLAAAAQLRPLLEHAADADGERAFGGAARLDADHRSRALSCARGHSSAPGHGPWRLSRCSSA